MNKVYIENLYNRLVFEKQKEKRSEMHLHDFFLDLFLTQVPREHILATCFVP